MKFTKDEALEKLKGILTNGGKKTLRMSEKSIERQLETLMPLVADDETELDDFIGKVKASFEVMNSNVEKDNSDFVNQWKKDHPEKDDKGGKDGNGGNGGGTSPAENPELQAILDRMKALEDRNSEIEREKTLSAKRDELKKKLKEKGVTNAEWCDMVLSEIGISEDTDIDAKAESLLKLYNKQKSEVRYNVSPLGPSGSEEKDAGKLFSDVKKLRDRKYGTDSKD